MTTTKTPKLDDLKPAPYNEDARNISPKALEALQFSLHEFGDISGFTWNQRTGHMVTGHQRLRGLTERHGDELKMRRGFIETPEGERFRVRVVDWPIEKEKAANIAANNPLLAGVFTDGLADLVGEVQLDTPELAGDLLMEQLLDSLGMNKSAADVDEDEIPEPPKKAITKPGDLWVLGEHRVLCGDATQQSVAERVAGGPNVDLICTDPPYCSGGFQESGRSAGSVGREVEHKHIMNDRLSTRGYAALLKAAFGTVSASHIYAFTDWRMWVYLFDIVESSGFGVRSMIVWNKGSPGMGRGWRAQHELVMWGCQAVPPFDKHASGQGNVIDCRRTGNVHHTTEKPVQLIATLLETVPFCQSILDPFLGSGTTLIAAEQLERRCYGLELDPLYCDVTVERWQNLTGGKAKRKKGVVA